MTTRIIVDSTADIALKHREEVTIVPLTVHFGNEEFIDGVTIDHDSFYNKMALSQELPTTSAASPGTFMEIFDEVKKSGDEAVAITLSSKLSGTYQSAHIASMEYEGIEVVDSGTVTLGANALILEAIRMAKAGHKAKEIAEYLEDIKKRIVIVAVLDTLDNLCKGGRLSKSAAFVGGVLNIKPVVSLIDGTIEVLGKVRGFKGASSQLIKEIEKFGGMDMKLPAVVGYSGNDDKSMKAFIENNSELFKRGNREIETARIGSVVGTHAGPGAIGVAFYRNEE